MEIMPINRSVLTVSEAASVLGVSSCTIYKMIRAGLIRAEKLGHIWKIPVNSINTFIAQKWLMLVFRHFGMTLLLSFFYWLFKQHQCKKIIKGAEKSWITNHWML